MRVHLFELLGSSERKWGVAGVWKIYPVELQDRARLYFPYTTYYHVESVLQKRLKRQDHPLLIVSISIYNNNSSNPQVILSNCSLSSTAEASSVNCVKNSGSFISDLSMYAD